ncbi:MAG TPA: amidohydrolase family protein [Vicinamibacterales bacterium]|nr:amidohydrolase family protein [Vicinamibacterales bacterium]
MFQRKDAKTLSVFLLIGLLAAGAAAQQPSSNTVALVGARVIDGTGAGPIANATILISKGRIERIGPSAALKVPAGATRMDVAGKTIIPGLVNAHGHLGHGDRTLPVYDQIIQQLQLYPKFGVTTVYSLGDDGVQSVRVSEENTKGPLTRARLFVSGARATGHTPEAARKVIADRHGLRVDIIKTGIGEGSNAPGQDMRSEAYTALIDEAHKRKLRVAAHLVTLADAKGLVHAGLDIIAHSIRDHDVDPAFIAELKRRNVGYIPTLTRDLSVFQYESTPDYINDPFFLRGMPHYASQIARVKDPALHAKTKANPETQVSKRQLEQGMRNLKLLSDAGVMIAMGTDSGTGLGRWQGYFEQVEMELMVKAGMTPMQALVASTGNAAKVMRLDDIGTLQPGKRADFVVLTADPLVDIKNTRTIESVWIDGRFTVGTARSR